MVVLRESFTPDLIANNFCICLLLSHGHVTVICNCRDDNAMSFNQFVLAGFASLSWAGVVMNYFKCRNH
jgi:hypothetical protein